MSDFYIEKILAKGTGKTDSVIELKNGLNIIQGRSNTGKTCITFVIFSAQQEQPEEHKVMFLAAVLIGKHLYVGT